MAQVGKPMTPKRLLLKHAFTAVKCGACGAVYFQCKECEFPTHPNCEWDSPKKAEDVQHNSNCPVLRILKMREYQGNIALAS